MTTPAKDYLIYTSSKDEKKDVSAEGGAVKQGLMTVKKCGKKKVPQGPRCLFCGVQSIDGIHIQKRRCLFCGHAGHEIRIR